jgi:phosphatidylserine/phosphatidylglycerophosphate/cardiolipin synthase-like enzyme
MHGIKRNGLILFLALIAAALSAQNYKIGFSPGGSAEGIVIEAIQSAKGSLLIACYEFTSRDIAEQVELAAHRGVKVRVVADSRAAASKYSQVPLLQAAGIPVRLATDYAIMHNKFMVIDDNAIETGSFNYTDGAVRHNAENVVWEWDVKDKAAVYAAEWNRLWIEAGTEHPKKAAPKRGGKKQKTLRN